MEEQYYVCDEQDMDLESVRRFDLDNKTYAIYRSPDGDFYATAGFCTHEEAHLSEGLVDEYEIECPRHFGAFDYRDGIATVAPACIDLKTYPVVVKDNKVYIELG
ncbi:Rieske 2Fe-2S domain-containing protein [Vibrio penaeicida]|uniref:Rieske 2Fe-2S domain-containing protein n=1 Tax=Vibrio penaeicida TaxID=104609 RepID=UPI000CEA24E1|nr:Rieske 2Fe-2S domain-containing protein [Vibrio penaeicida]